MRKHSKLLLTALTAAFVLASAVGTASANRLSVSNQNFRIVWSPLTFSNAGGGIELECNVTLEGSFHSASITKTRGLLIGHITRAIVGHETCEGGEAWTLTAAEGFTESLPWHVRYNSFSGELPSIRGVTLDLVGASFLLEVLGLSCLYRSTEASPARGIANVASGVITGLRADESVSIPKASGSIFCPANGVFRGTGTVTLLGTSNSISVSLI